MARPENRVSNKQQNGIRKRTVFVCQKNMRALFQTLIRKIVADIVKIFGVALRFVRGCWAFKRPQNKAICGSVLEN